MTDDKTTSEPEKLLPCPFCGTRAHQGLTKVEHCQLHGEPIQRFEIWCPHQCARINRVNRKVAIIAWNTRLSSPVSGTDMVMVPREPTEAMTAAGDDAIIYHPDDIIRNQADVVWSAMLSASPTPPIPMIAEAGEREAIGAGSRVKMRETGETGMVLRVSYVVQCDEDDGTQGAMGGTKWIGHCSLDEIAALSTPATLDNTAATDRDAMVRYVTHYGPRCRDCADEDGVCPATGIGCGQRAKAAAFVVDALIYGAAHGYVPATLTAKTEKAE